MSAETVTSSMAFARAKGLRVRDSARGVPAAVPTENDTVQSKAV